MDLTIQNKEITISSLEIAERTGKEHKNVKRDIVDVLSKVSDVPKFERIYKDSMNRDQIEYVLPKREALILVSGYSVELRAAIIDRLDELEKEKNKPLLPQTYIEALEALTQAEKDKLALSETIKQKDEVILSVADLNIKAGNVSIADFAKNLAIEGMGQNNMFAWLKGRGFLMMNTEPYQQYVERGYFVRKPYEKKVNGETRYRTMLTPKGTIWLAKMLRAEFEIED